MNENHASTGAGRGKRRVLFYRSWTNRTGGSNGANLKVRDAYRHFQDSTRFVPRVHFGRETVWSGFPGNLWTSLRDEGEPQWRIRDDDVLFLSEDDWRILAPEQRADPPVPVLNIVHPTHAAADDRRHADLRFPAIRIVKSSVGKSMIESVGANGPVVLVPDAIDTSLVPAPNPAPDIDVLIVGLKRPEFAASLQKAMRGDARLDADRLRVEIQIPPKLPTRGDFLRLLNRARIAVFLPFPKARGGEGFYLPALEAMAMETLVVCPDVYGNADFCIPGDTCIRPEYDERSLVDAVRAALSMSDDARRRMLAAAKSIVGRHTIEKERAALLDLLHRADDLWRDDRLFDFRPTCAART